MVPFNLIRKIAWSFHFTTGLDYDELFSEASLAYWEAMQSYNKEKSMQTTYAYSCIERHLIDFCRKQKDINYLDNTQMDVYGIDNTNYEYFNQIPKIVKMILITVITSDIDYSQFVPKKAKSVLTKELREKGVSYEKIEIALKKTREYMKNNDININALLKEVDYE